MTNSQHRIAVSRPGRRAGRRRLLLASTALTAALLAPSQGRAGQPAPMTTPQGGTVVGGSATISQAPGTTTITQTSQRAAIDWQSFNLGSKARVTFNQPNAQAIALNRVIANNPSIIAGRIDANGRIVLVNQDGVVFTPGSEVNAESLVVSTSGISPKNFMAGKLIFDQQPKPGARIVNDGRITMKQAGLAAFVAPEVINRGTITAQLGHVVLAGASAFTLNLSGDGLISINVTQAVRQIDLGGRKVTALVTNEGTIIANGGRITLTARAVDGLIQQLLDVGGTLRADSVGRQPGAITIQGVGGDLQVAGQLLARGETPGSSGGTIAVDATGNVSVASTARIDASGPAGGGVVALGTDAARALQGPSDTTAPKAARVAIAQGATISADATRNGNGGRITVLSRDRTTAAGTISAQGAGNGDGGLIEISSDGVISLSGTDTTFAPSGRNGTILLDPQTLIVTASGGTPSAGTTTTSGTLTVGTDSSTSSYIDASILDSQTGAVELSASSLISIASAISSSSISTLAMNSGGDIRIAAPVTLTAGSIEATANGTIEVSGALGASSISLLDTASSPTNKIDINANIDAQTLSLDASGGTISNSGSGTGYINASSLDIVTASSVVLTGSNSITTLEDFVANSITLVDQSALTLAGTVSVATHGQVAFITRGLDDTSGATFLAPDGTIEIAPLGSSTIAGTLDLGGTSAGNVNVSTNFVTLLADSGAALLDLGTANAGTGTLAGGVIFDGNLPSFTPTLMVEASGSIVNRTILQAGTGTFSGGSIVNDGVLSVGNITVTGSDFSGSGAVTADSLAGSVSGFASLQNGGNSIKVITSLSAGSSIDVADSQPLTIAGALSAGSSINVADSQSLNIAGTLSVASGGNIVLSANGMDLAGGTILANSGAVTLAPLSFDTIALGGTSTTALDLSNQLLNAIGANSLQIGTVQTGLIEDDGSISLSIPNILMDAGTININQPFLAQHSSLIVQAGGEFTGNGGITVAALGAAASLVALTGSNAITTLGSISAGSFTLDDNAPLTIAGPFTATNASITNTGSLDITGSFNATDASLAASDIRINANLDATTLSLDANAGTITNAGSVTGYVTASNLDATASLVALTGSNSITTLGSISAGSFTLDDNAPLTIAGSFNATNASFADTSAGGLDIAGQVSLASLLALSATSGSITSSGTGSISAPTLDAAASLVALTGSNVITTLGSINVGTFTLDDNAPLTIAGSLVAQRAAISAADLTIPGVILVDGALSLATSGTISETGTIDPTLLQIAGARDVLLTGSNTIDALGSVSVPLGNLALVDQVPLTVNGPVYALNISLDSPAMYIPGAINTPGTLGLGYGPISGNGPITAATLTSNSAVIGDVALTGTENVIGTLGGFDAAGHLFALTDATALTVAGPVSAKALTITATGQITLDGADGGSFSIGGQFLPTYVYNGLSPRNGIDSVLQVIANGAPANGIVQTGQFNIDTGPLQGQPNTLFMLLPDGADAKFNDLNARSTDLAISLINGYAQGTLYLHYLLVAGGLNGQTAFVGQIAGLAGSAAAHNGKVVPVPGSSYRFNSCIIGSVSCTVLPVAIVPERNPLDDFDISPRRRRKLDANVRLPGVAAKDY
ncbi:filamentous hemagglutinin N-terminal domain-containing protein [Acidiphilium sp.]|uniref:beta strand repeat-containing protein n=1 Tax=Acidiphilium sp. TaxID=527 RepID=UPI0025910C96|nr:filamentous hemagglutinin N-terminal domain-containing protein [Acidiphilium sp.]